MGPGPLLLAALLLAGCRGVETSYRYPDDLWHPNYVKRTKAAREFAARSDATQLPRAFDLLLDREDHIRDMAYLTLRTLSAGGRDFGYKPWMPEPVREGIVARWRAWWEAGQPGEAGAPAAPPAADAPADGGGAARG
ncbi:MAG: hypothetical protein ACT4PV_01730 [Planctomycetaceae bacterium]